MYINSIVEFMRPKFEKGQCTYRNQAYCCGKELYEFIVTFNPEVHVDVGELEKKEAKKRKRKKTRSLIENEYFKKKCENEKREDSLWPREKNERKVEKQSNCERVSEVKSILFSKQNIFDLIYKRTCFLTVELNSCFSIASFEFLQEAKIVGICCPKTRSL